MSTRVLRRLKNASAGFQATIPPLFDKLESEINAWTDNLIIDIRTENDVLEHVKDFFKISDE